MSNQPLDGRGQARRRKVAVPHGHGERPPAAQLLHGAQIDAQRD
jgi:hypothetical protein